MAISLSKGLLISASLIAVLSLGACAHGNHHDVSSNNQGGGDPDPGPGPGPSGDGTVGTLVDTTTDTTGGVLVAAGNTLLGVADQTSLPVVSPVLGQVGQTVANLGDGLGENGLGAVPVVGGVLNNTVGTADSLVGGLANITVGDLPVLNGPTGSTPLIGVGALSGNPTNGSLASLNTLPTSGAGQLSGVSVGGTQVLGQAGQTGAVNLSLNLSPGSGAPNPLGGAGPVGGVVSGAAGAAGGLVGGLTAGGAGSGATGGLTGLVGGVAGGATGGGTTGGLVGGLVGGLTGGH